MTDRTLFILDAERRYRLAYDRRQWIIQKRRGKNWDAVWFVGDTKASLEDGLHRFEIELTSDARAHLDRLPESFPRFRREAWLPGGKHVGWNIEDGIRARGRAPERDDVLEGVYHHPGEEETPPCASQDSDKAA